ncbi:aldo/keto reductase [Paenibacillus sp. GSMTC-2017]|uniref:aldo/keto reductase n=1 Tax=Paenibacillus sp. GSMTC-2017 TaxID=2794350 RepID=UPI0018D6E0F1|nr:aldo/keto reductase [Paenibacillus sp. GSMTC-2017]MBH5316202.1 aldo/keto reductase [Paenibacillus sp. GSMTC-2017]
MYKKLGNTEIEVSSLGLGCWAIGGHFTLDGIPDGWGEVNDTDSIEAIQTAIDMGVNFFDTADAYGAGHSEQILGLAVKGRRNEIVIATKFGYTNDESTKEVFGKYDVSPSYIRSACQQSLKRLGTDYIDLYQIHVGVINHEEMESTIDTLNRLRQEGLIRSYGWSTYDVALAEAFARKSDAAAIQHTLNVLRGDAEMISLCDQNGLTSINNSPLAMGLLSGKFNPESKLAKTDVRGSGHEWVAYFKDGKPVATYLAKLEAIKEILTSNNRTLVQGALAWIWGRSDAAIPIPGFKTKKQVEELAGAVELGSLTKEQMVEIEGLLKR